MRDGNADDGADAMVRTRFYVTPLHLAAADNGNPIVIESLLNPGCK